MNRFEKSLERINKNVFPQDNWNDEDIEHLKTVFEALEKQIPKKPLQACGHATNRTMNFCPMCGQALDWSKDVPDAKDGNIEKGGAE